MSIITDPDMATTDVIDAIMQTISGQNIVLTSEIVDMLLDLRIHVEPVINDYCDAMEKLQDMERTLAYYEEAFDKVDVPVDYIVPWFRSLLTPEGLERAQQVRRDRAAAESK
jgi:hypothetical protein